jgi:hypothetical protein
MDGNSLAQLLPPLTPLLGTFQPGQPVRLPALHAKFYTYYVEFAPLAGGALGTRAAITVDGKTEGFAVYGVSILADNLGAKLFVQTSEAGEALLGLDPMYLSQLGGGQWPTEVRPPWLIRRTGQLIAIADDRQLVAAANTIRVAFHGAKLYRAMLVPPRRYQNSRYFLYPANFTPNDSGPASDPAGVGSLAANATRFYTVRVDPVSDFLVTGISIVSDAAVTLQTLSDDDQWYDTPLRSELLGGSLIENPVAPLASGYRVFRLPAPRFISGGGYIKSIVANQVAAVNRCEVQYHGIRLYPKGGA